MSKDQGCIIEKGNYEKVTLVESKVVYVVELLNGELLNMKSYPESVISPTVKCRIVKIAKEWLENSVDGRTPKAEKTRGELFAESMMKEHARLVNRKETDNRKLNCLLNYVELEMATPDAYPNLKEFNRGWNGALEDVKMKLNYLIKA